MTSRTWFKVALWVAAVVLMAGAGMYQRLTGPTCPIRGVLRTPAQEHEYSLTRLAYSTKPTRVEVPAPGDATEATLLFRRYPVDEPLSPAAMVREGDRFVGRLPAQPPAGKLEYHVRIETPAGTIRVPESPDDDPIIRYKGEVPGWLLIPHITMMFLAVMLGLRTGLAAAFGHLEVRKLALATLAFMTVGGMILGPIVQKHAFGEYWTGFPNGGDLTDNKMLLMWLVWFGACAVLGFRRPRSARSSRLVVAAATLVMLVVYLIPHSLRGSELDYDKLREGADPTESISTG